MFGFSRKKFQVNLSRPRKKPVLTAPPTPKHFDISFRKIAYTLFAIFVLASFWMAFGERLFDTARFEPYFEDDVSTTKEGTDTATNSIAYIVSEVNKQYLLPEGETPTMALITSLDDLAGQEFFAKAEIGDIVLLYMDAKKGVLWRPATRQVVEVGPIKIREPKTETP